MTAIRAVFDGKVFVPQEPVTAAPASEALVLFSGTDPAAQRRLDEEVRAYYQSGDHSEDAEWGKAVEHDLGSAWDED